MAIQHSHHNHRHHHHNNTHNLRNDSRADTPDASPFVLAAKDNNTRNNNKYTRNNSNTSSNNTTLVGGPGQPYSFNNDERKYRAEQRRLRGGIGGEDEDEDEENTCNDEDEDDNMFHEKPHESVGFWHHKLSKVRKHVLLQWVRTVLILMIAVMGLLSLYWAALFEADSRTRDFVVYVVDFDGQVAPYDNVPNPFVGETMAQVARRQYESPEVKSSLGYQVLSPAEFDYDPTAVRQAVYDWRCWAAVIIHPNATALLREAVAAGNSSYSPSGSVQYIIQTARQESSTYDYIIPDLDALTRAFTTEFGQQWSRELMSNNSLSRATMARAPAAVNPGITPLQIDLRPFQPSAATASVSIGLIYLIIISFFSFSFLLPIHMKYVQPQGHPPLHFWQLVIWRWTATTVAYLFVSLAYSLVSMAMQIPFWMPPASPTEVAFNPTAYGRGSFPVYWMVNFLGMMALGLASENVAMVLGQPWSALWLMFWVITNVTTSFYAFEILPHFFAWGYAWPLRQVVEASRHILFDLRSDIGLNIGILLAWIAVDTILFPLCCYFMRWKTEHEKRSQEKNKDRFVVKTTDGDKHLPKEEGEKPPVRNRGFMRGL